MIKRGGGTLFAFFFLNNSFFILDEAEEEIEIETIAIHRFNIDNMMKSSTRNFVSTFTYNFSRWHKIFNSIPFSLAYRHFCSIQLSLSNWRITYGLRDMPGPSFLIPVTANN